MVRNGMLGMLLLKITPNISLRSNKLGLRAYGKKWHFRNSAAEDSSQHQLEDTQVGVEDMVRNGILGMLLLKIPPNISLRTHKLGLRE